jgi:Fe-S-cluster containining protein
MRENIIKTECDRCGICCTKGGPALHYDDRVLLQDNFLQAEHLITIRKGEPALSLPTGNPEPTQSEIVKIKGRGTEWTCLFFQEKGAKCTIYEHRPLECTLLKCWDTENLEKVGGRNLLSRYDIIPPYDPIIPFLKAIDEKCSLGNLALHLSALNRENSRQQAMNELTSLVNTDLAIRSQAFADLHFSLNLELFFFGRPLFKILAQFGINTHEKNGFCSLSLPSSSSAMLPNDCNANQNP